MCLHRKLSGFSSFVVHCSPRVDPWQMLKAKVVRVVGDVDAGFKTKDKEKSINCIKGYGKPSVSFFPLNVYFPVLLGCCSVQDVYSL